MGEAPLWRLGYNFILQWCVDESSILEHRRIFRGRGGISPLAGAKALIIIDISEYRAAITPHLLLRIWGEF